MTHTQKFIEDAMAGGWKPKDELMPKLFLWRKPFKVFVAGSISSLYFDTEIPNAEKESILVRVSDILLDPLAWQAVGKTRGWTNGEKITKYGRANRIREWLYNWHRFIDHLADGKTIEEALGSL